MHKRWYDTNPTLSMAISLLQNAPQGYRNQVVTFLESRLKEKYQLTVATNPLAGGLLAFIQKRRRMDEHSWLVIELMKDLPEDDRHKLSVEVIHMIYCLEGEGYNDFALENESYLEAAV